MTASRLRESGKPRPVPGQAQVAEVVVRDLADYDTGFGVDLGTSIEETS